MSQDYFNARDTLHTSHGSYVYYRLDQLEKDSLTKLDKLPFSIRVMLEGLLRQCDDKEITQEDVRNLAAWKPNADYRPSMPFRPGRVVMQDFTGVPAVVDILYYQQFRMPCLKPKSGKRISFLCPASDALPGSLIISIHTGFTVFMEGVPPLLPA